MHKKPGAKQVPHCFRIKRLKITKGLLSPSADFYETVFLVSQSIVLLGRKPNEEQNKNLGKGLGVGGGDLTSQSPLKKHSSRGQALKSAVGGISQDSPENYQEIQIYRYVDIDVHLSPVGHTIRTHKSLIYCYGIGLWNNLSSPIWS